MPFQYPTVPHIRRHGPAGYADYSGYKDWLRDEFSFRCVYCLECERWYPSGSDAFGVDQYTPKSTHKDLECDYTNLLYACNRCNAAKGTLLGIDPGKIALAVHLRVNADGTITSLSTEGQCLIELLHLDDDLLVRTRKRYLLVFELFERSPDDSRIRELAIDAFGYPDVLPDLTPLRPPRGNSFVPVGIREVTISENNNTTNCQKSIERELLPILPFHDGTAPFAFNYGP